MLRKCRFEGCKVSLEKKMHDFEVGDANSNPLHPHHHTHPPRISKHLYSYLLRIYISAYRGGRGGVGEGGGRGGGRGGEAVT